MNLKDPAVTMEGADHMQLIRMTSRRDLYTSQRMSCSDGFYLTPILCAHVVHMLTLCQQRVHMLVVQQVYMLHFQHELGGG